MIVYCAHNALTGKRYFGATTMSLKRRWYDHVYRAKKGVETVLYQAIRKYGEDMFGVFAFASALPGATIDDLFELEMAVIEQEGSLAPAGYNLTVGGDGTLGYVMTEAQLERRTANHKPWSEERRAAQIIRGRAFRHTPEAKARIGAAAKARNTGRVGWSRGKKLSPELRAKLSESAKRRWARERSMEGQS